MFPWMFLSMQVHRLAVVDAISVGLNEGGMSEQFA